MIKAVLPALDKQFGMVSRKNQSAPIVALGKATSLETAEFWEWFGSLGSKKEQDYLGRFIISEFLLILNEIMKSSRGNLRHFASDGVRHLRLLALSAILPIGEQLEMSIRLYQARATHPPGNDADAAAVGEFEGRAGARIARYESLSVQLNDLTKRCLLMSV